MKSTLAGFMWGVALWAALAMPVQSVAGNKPESLSYTITDLGPVGPTPGQAFNVTKNGLTAGAAAAPNGTMHAVLWLSRFKFDLGKRGLGGANSVAFGANVWGQTVGVAETASTDPNGEDFCGFKALGLPTSGSSCLPFLWQVGALTRLPTLV